MEMDFEPFGDRVLVKQDEVDAGLVRSPISIPENQKEAPLEGVVLVVGSGRWDHGVVVQAEAEKGDRVLFGRYSGTPVWVNGVEYLLLRDEEILGRRKPRPAGSSEEGKHVDAYA